MSQPYIGEIRIFGGNFAPAGWAFCNGQLLPISENDALFTLIGTTYGGDGQSTFALPDLRGRLPVHMGNGSVLAEQGGVEQVTLITSQIPAHNHALTASSNNAAAGSPQGREFATDNANFLFTPAIALGRSKDEIAALKAQGKAKGKDIGVLTFSHVVCRPTDTEARDYVYYIVDEKSDWEATDNLIRLQLAHAVLGRFFAAVLWAASLALVSGVWMIGRVAKASVQSGGNFSMPLTWTVMASLGVLMVALFGHIRFVLYPRFGAAVAAAAAMTLCEPVSNGLGSDAFCILWDGKALHGLNASGRAPQRR